MAQIMALQDVMAVLLGANTNAVGQQQASETSQLAMAQTQETFAPFSLGTFDTPDNRKRHRKEIYTKWEKMLAFAPIAEGVGIHVTAALGGDSTTGQQVFITPAMRLRGKDKGANAKVQLKQLEDRIKHLEGLINANISKILRDALGFGDAYVRVWGEKGKGVLDIVCNEHTYPPLVQAYEQGSRTVAYHALDMKNWQKTISKFTMVQMLRLKMPRITHVPQYDMTDGAYSAKVLQSDNLNELPVFPAPVGGSFMYEIEKPYENVILALSTMNSQQIADAVNQMFLTINMSGMPPAQRDAYKRGLSQMLKDHGKFVRNALEGGEAIWETKYHILPTFDEKQVLNPIGDIKGQRSSPVNIETFMINVRLMMGGLGLDPSMVGWADMLSGGLGDGASFHTSAQIMRRAINTRNATKKFLNQLIALDWGYRYGEFFESEQDYPWQVEFYSDQSAAMSEELSNKQARMSALIVKAQAMAQLKELGISEENAARLLERDGGMDYEEAMALAKDLKASSAVGGEQAGGEEPAGNENLDDEDDFEE